jgi:hypothetical protein
MPPETPTQYDSPEAHCECEPCAACDGEGLVMCIDDGEAPSPCSYCGGSGVDNSLCEIHIGELAPKRVEHESDEDGRYDEADRKLTLAHEDGE